MKGARRATSTKPPLNTAPPAPLASTPSAAANLRRPLASARGAPRLARATRRDTSTRIASRGSAAWSQRNNVFRAAARGMRRFEILLVFAAAASALVERSGGGERGSGAKQGSVFRRYDAIVCTPLRLVSLLRKGALSLDGVSLPARNAAHTARAAGASTRRRMHTMRARAREGGASRRRGPLPCPPYGC